MSRKRNILQLVTLATLGVGSALVINPQEALAVDIDPGNWGTYINDDNIGPDDWQLKTGENLYQEVFLGDKGFDLIDVAGVPTVRISGWAALRGFNHHLSYNHAYGIAVMDANTGDQHVYQAIETQHSATTDFLVEGEWMSGYPTDSSKIHNSIWPTNTTGIPDLVTDGRLNVASNVYEPNAIRGNYIYDYVGYQVDIPAADIIKAAGTDYTFKMYLLTRFLLTIILFGMN